MLKIPPPATPPAPGVPVIVVVVHLARGQDGQALVVQASTDAAFVLLFRWLTLTRNVPELALKTPPPKSAVLLTTWLLFKVSPAVL